MSPRARRLLARCISAYMLQYSCSVLQAPNKVSKAAVVEQKLRARPAAAAGGGLRRRGGCWLLSDAQRD